ncbi:MAG: Sec-independent protein translocase subunit TatA/TatB [Solirubrobacterales bacterium]
MPNVGPLELAIVLIIALVIFGPKRLPELGKSLGSGLREFKSSIASSSEDSDEPRKIEGSASDAESATPAPDERPAEAHPVETPDSDETRS